MRTATPRADPSIDAPLTGIALDPILAFMRLIWAIDHELERLSKQMETSLGLTIPQRMCLLLIAAHPGVLASQLAEFLHLHRGTLSGILQRLESAGLIARTANPRDARRAGLTLTQAGAALKGRQQGTFEKAVRTLLAETSDRDLAATERVLKGLCRELSAASSIT